MSLLFLCVARSGPVGDEGQQGQACARELCLPVVPVGIPCKGYRTVAWQQKCLQGGGHHLAVGQVVHDVIKRLRNDAVAIGVEVDLQGRLDSGLGVWFSYAYIDAEVSGDVLDPNFALPVRAGSPLINIPEHSLSLQVTQELQLAGRPLTFGGGAMFVDDRLGETGTTFELPSYTIVRVFATYDLTSAFSLRADIDNLTDETYYTNSFSRLWVQPGAPRNIRVSAMLRF